MKIMTNINLLKKQKSTQWGSKTMRDYHYKCDANSYQILRNLIGGKEVYNKEFNRIISSLINRAGSKTIKTPLGV